MKTRIKIRVTPEQSKQVQKIYHNAELKIYISTEYPFIYISEEVGLIYGIDLDFFNEHEYLEVSADLFIRTNGTCEETEENKMEWIEYDRQELEEGKDYLVCTQEEVNIVIFTKASNWKFIGVTAYMELPKPYEKPKSLKERLDEAVERYCYKFSDEELKDVECGMYYIVYGYKTNRFFVDSHFLVNNFTKYNFKEIKNAQSFIDSFTAEELMQIMKGEVK